MYFATVWTLLQRVTEVHRQERLPAAARADDDLYQPVVADRLSELALDIPLGETRAQLSSLRLNCIAK